MLLAETTGLTAACDALCLPRSAVYRRRQVKPLTEKTPRPRPPRALLEAERTAVMDTLHAERFVDKAPREIWAELLEAGIYLCSIRTMYRLLEEHGELRERRDQRRHPEYNRPELLATGPLQVWSWDITLLRGPQKGVYYRLYVLMDIFSRYVVGWMLAEREDAELAKHFLADTHAKQGSPIDLTIHADNGPAPASDSVSRLLRHLGITESHSRPHVSDDNPYSEALFKTKKYRPDFPDRFASIDAARPDVDGVDPDPSLVGNVRVDWRVCVQSARRTGRTQTASPRTNLHLSRFTQLSMTLPIDVGTGLGIAPTNLMIAPVVLLTW